MNGLRFCRTRGGIRVSPALLVLAAFVLTTTSSVRADVLGACCFDDGTCQDDLDPISCAYAGGRFMGEGRTCVEVECPEYGECGWKLTAPTWFFWTTIGQGDNCNWVDGSEDEQFEITIPYSGEWSFSLCDGADWDTVITLGTECCGFDLGFDDNGCPGGLQSLLHFDVLEADTYFLNLEHVLGMNGGVYSLIIRDHNADCIPPSCPPGAMLSQPPALPDSEHHFVESDIGGYHTGYERYSVPDDIKEVRWWGTCKCHQYPHLFFVKFFEDDGSAYPGDVVASYEYLVQPVMTGCFYDDPDLPLWEFTVELDPPCALREGWISVQGESDQECCCFDWISSQIGDGDSVECAEVEPPICDERPVCWHNDFDLAFCLNSGLLRVVLHGEDFPPFDEEGNPLPVDDPLGWWDELWPEFETEWHCTGWNDADENEIVSEGDDVVLASEGSDPNWWQVDWIGLTVTVKFAVGPSGYFYLEFQGDLEAPDFPLGLYHEVYPTYCNHWEATDYLDANGNQILDSGDYFSFEINGDPPEFFELLAVATDLEVIQEENGNLPPHAGDVTGWPDPVCQGKPLALTTDGAADPDGTVEAVWFYHDANGNGHLDDNDTYLGEGELQAPGVWTLTDIPTDAFPIGENLFFAQAQDNEGLWGNESKCPLEVLEHCRMHLQADWIDPFVPVCCPCRCWDELWPYFATLWKGIDWIDDGSGEFDAGDYIAMDDFVDEPHWWHADRVTVTVTLEPQLGAQSQTWTWMEWQGEPFPPPPHDDNTYNGPWREVHPGYDIERICTGWWDSNDNGFLDATDWLSFEAQEGARNITLRVVNAARGIEIVEQQPPGMYLDGPDFDPHEPVTDPVGDWHELHPVFCTAWECTAWEDDGDEVLSESDLLTMDDAIDPPRRWYVDGVTFTAALETQKGNEPEDYLYLDYVDSPDTFPIGQWHEVYPEFSSQWECTDWLDSNNNDLLDETDWLVFDAPGDNVINLRVAQVATDIELTRAPTPVPMPCPCPADFNCDGEVNTEDLLYLLGRWGTPCGDVDGDGDTDTADLLALLGVWGPC